MNCDFLTVNVDIPLDISTKYKMNAVFLLDTICVKAVTPQSDVTFLTEDIKLNICKSPEQRFDRTVMDVNSLIMQVRTVSVTFNNIMSTENSTWLKEDVKKKCSINPKYDANIFKIDFNEVSDSNTCTSTSCAHVTNSIISDWIAQCGDF